MSLTDMRGPPSCRTGRLPIWQTTIWGRFDRQTAGSSACRFPGVAGSSPSWPAASTEHENAVSVFPYFQWLAPLRMPG
jgi:hypothetical protein